MSKERNHRVSVGKEVSPIRYDDEPSAPAYLNTPKGEWEVVSGDQVKLEQMNRIEELIRQTLKMESMDLLDDLSITTNFNGLKIKMSRGKNKKSAWQRSFDSVYRTIESSIRSFTYPSRLPSE